MILIADSGSTKTDWRMWNKDTNEVFSYFSAGLNPYFTKSDEIAQVVNSIIPNELISDIKHIYFYGSGCSSEASKKIVADGLKKSCPHSKLEINHDLMAAARALLGSNEGIACIMGTGSNACYYNGKKIEEEGVSYGYVMGDEGSGNHLGRLLLKSVFSKKAPQEILDSFYVAFPQLDLPALLKEIYQKTSPNKFLAGFSPFILQNRNHPFIHKLIIHSFEEFYNEFILNLRKDDANIIGFQGSIAHFYRKEIEKVFQDKGFKTLIFLEKPIEELLKYHQENFI